MAKKSYSILPGVKLNSGKKGFTSVTIGKKGASVNFKLDNTPPSPEDLKRKRRANWRFLLRTLSIIFVILFGGILVGLLSQEGPIQYKGIIISSIGTVLGIFLWILGNRIMRNT